MKLLFTRFPLASAYGGAEYQTLSLMQGLAARGHEVEFLGSCPTLLTLCKEYDLTHTQLDIGIPPVTKTGAISFLWRRGRMRRMLLAAVEGKSLDAIYMLSLSEKLLLTEAANARVFWVEHDSIGRWLTRNPFRRQLERLSRIATTVGVSDLSRQMYVELGWDPNRTISIPNGIDAARFGNGAGLTGQTDTVQIGCIARLAHEKGVDLLIRAMPGVGNAKLTIVGTGACERSLRALIAELELDHTVDIAPKKPDVGAFYRSLDLLVLPSRSHDPFGLVAAEAMTLGVPVLVTDACGIASELEHGTDASIVPANSAAALAEAVRTLVEDASMRQALARAGSAKAQRDFTVTRMVDRYEALLR